MSGELITLSIFMTKNATAAEIIAALQLEALPNEGGFFRPAYRSAVSLSDGRAAGSAIYFLITPEGFSALHSLRTEELWHFYAGDPVEHLRLDPATGNGYQTRLGSAVLQGQVPLLVVSADLWQGARLASGGNWALLGCTMSPGWDEREFVLGERAPLAATFAAWAKEIQSLTR